MNGSSALAQRERLIVGTGLAAVSVVAWGYTVYEARKMNLTGVCECLRLKMGGPELSTWPAATLLPLSLMWAVMMVAMMLPSAMPMVLMFASVTRNRRQVGRAYVPTAVFVCGYVVIWCGFSVIAALSQWFLHRHALLSAEMTSSSAVLAGALLFAAGIFQFTPLKQSCLSRCRGTMEFVMTRWREGRRGAFQMGLEHGAFCTGCCWALMGLLFVTGVMNILWIAALTTLVCLEKISPARIPMSFAIGLFLAVWGASVLGYHYFPMAML